ncbi:replication restart DNA helicase PriA [Propionibacterium cyclohexanicum]|uniref:Probable replication restart protein PriA n=1 Tax=Propionibacterium cyclohexanicum TaxID=64702 RepID=A0A1H9Q1B3_9ACTN|nr:primosomal protein N' [Propionibacterium cyclohexanicum]SER54224.1 replication restart DNA helicase PriA [Propionibacterium cyclohexanicum]
MGDTAEPKADPAARTTGVRTAENALGSAAPDVLPRIARVALDVYLPHLDRFFDYSIPPAMAAEIAVGVRVRARFAGRMAAGFVVDLPATSEVEKLAPLSKMISAEPVLLPEQVQLLRAVADHWAGTFADVLRLAVPPRHAATEAAEQTPWPLPLTPPTPGDGLRDDPGGQTFLDRIAQGEPVRAHWNVPPRWKTDQAGADDWTRGVVQATLAVLRAGRGVLVVVPDVVQVRRVRDVLAQFVGQGAIAELHTELGPAARYRNYLAVARRQARVLVGTRGAVFAPIHALGLICLWDDGDDLLAEPRAPYCHARDVAAIRAVQASCALLMSSYGRTAEVQSWIERGWMAPIGSPPAHTRRRCAPVRVAADSDEALRRDPLARATRLPSIVFDTIRAGLAAGPVLVQVPRAGYLAALSCQRCRTAARCPSCQGPLKADRLAEGHRHVSCTWCGRTLGEWSCPVCGGRELRAPVVGSARTAEELGRAFPGTRLVDSSGDHVVREMGASPALVVSTPGGEPRPQQGYSAAVLLDAAIMLGRADLRAAEESLRRWLGAAALVRPGEEGGTICLVGPAQDRAVQALVRLDPAGFAALELQDRAAAGFPPAVTMLVAQGSADALASLGKAARWPPGAEELGPVPLPPNGADSGELRLIVRAPRQLGAALAAAGKHALAVRTARKEPGALRLQIDPVAAS